MPQITGGNQVSSSDQIAPGVIVDSDISAGAAIADSKLATIATAGKVSGAALTLLANIPAGAGNIPSANLGNAAGAPLVGEDTTDVDTSSVTTLFSVSIPGGTLEGAVIRVEIWIDSWKGDGNTNQLNLKYGATTLVQFSNFTSNADNNGGKIEAVIIGTGASAQEGGFILDARETGLSVAGTEQTRFFLQGFGTAAEDSSSAKNLVIDTNAGDTGRKITSKFAFAQIIS